MAVWKFYYSNAHLTLASKSKGSGLNWLSDDLLIYALFNSFVNSLIHCELTKLEKNHSKFANN